MTKGKGVGGDYGQGQWCCQRVRVRVLATGTCKDGDEMVRGVAVTKDKGTGDDQG